MIEFSYRNDVTDECGTFGCDSAAFAGLTSRRGDGRRGRLLGGVVGDATPEEVMALSTVVASSVVELLAENGVSRDDVCRALIADLRRIRSGELPLGPVAVTGDGGGE